MGTASNIDAQIKVAQDTILLKSSIGLKVDM